MRMLSIAEKEIHDSDGDAEWKEEKEDLKKEIEDLLKGVSGEENKNGPSEEKKE